MPLFVFPAIRNPVLSCQASWVTWPFSAAVHGIPSTSFLNKLAWSSKSRTDNLLLPQPAQDHVLHSSVTTTQALITKGLITTIPSFSLVVKSRSSCQTLLGGSDTIKKLSLMPSRNLLDCLHPNVLYLQQISDRLKLSPNPWFVIKKLPSFFLQFSSAVWWPAGKDSLVAFCQAVIQDMADIFSWARSVTVLIYMNYSHSVFKTL